MDDPSYEEHGGEPDPEMDAVVAELTEEVKLWQEECNCMPGDVINFDQFLIEQYLNSLATFLVDKGIIDDREFTLHFKRRQLEAMRDHRPRVKQARLELLQQRLKPPMMIPPSGKPRKH